ncbi:alpha- and gamma-adaptin-binding protein p34 [Holotrichia oblita]|uniref:Alpha- and gamma-adaptin-binding protein p34 n=1 Tax=Holotrichia oblita TaxID=644536 RepID=A0ACB9TAQ9_HOLOL|nr:alpha- and gamma-adaptin-binding protein p34 [Holotrichia oblita]
MADLKPSIVIVSNSKEKPKYISEIITQNADIKYDGPHKLSCSWTIDTKYYTADVDIHGITEHYQRDDNFNESVRALIVYTDCNIENALQDLNKWECIENDCDPEVKLLISDYCDDKTKISSSDVKEWCRKRGYEFVVLHSTEMESDDEEEIIKEKKGIDRVIEALQTCIWPNLQMKELDTAGNSKISSIGHHNNEEASLNDLIDEVLLDEGMDEFTELFGQLHMMKQSVQSLSGAERKQRAEEMVTAFWKAIGGDEDEIQDL